MSESYPRPFLVKALWNERLLIIQTIKKDDIGHEEVQQPLT